MTLAEKIATAILTVNGGVDGPIECERAQMMKKGPDGSEERDMGGRNKQSIVNVINEILENERQLNRTSLHNNDHEITMNINHSIGEAVEYMIKYMTAYPEQRGYEKYSLEIYLKDLLYGIGVSINPEKYSFAQGAMAFSHDLMEFLSPSIGFDFKRAQDYLADNPSVNLMDRKAQELGEKMANSTEQRILQFVPPDIRTDAIESVKYLESRGFQRTVPPNQDGEQWFIDGRHVATLTKPVFQQTETGMKVDRQFGLTEYGKEVLESIK